MLSAGRTPLPRVSVVGKRERIINVFGKGVNSHLDKITTASIIDYFTDITFGYTPTADNLKVPSENSDVFTILIFLRKFSG